MRRSGHRHVIPMNKKATHTEKKILISGITGLVGRSLAPQLAERGWQVVGLGRRTGLAGFPHIQWDPAKGILEPEKLEGFQAVLHLAGEGIADKRWSKKRMQALFNSRVGGTDLLARTCAQLQQPPKVFISASAIGFYGNQGSKPLTEKAPPGADFVAHLCQAWEAAATTPFKQTPTPPRLVQARIGVVLTPLGGALKKMLLPFRVGLGGPLGRGDQYMSWISLPDLLSALAFLLEEEGLSGPVNLVAPEPLPNKAFSTALGAALGRPAILPVPGPLVRLLFGEMGQALLLSGQRILPEKLTQAGFSFSHPSILSAMSAMLGKKKKHT